MSFRELHPSPFLDQVYDMENPFPYHPPVQ
jgi:hypothetical protein